MSCSDTDSLQPALIVSSTVNSPAMNLLEMKDSVTEHGTAAFTISNPIKLRYFICNFLTLISDVWVLESWFEFIWNYLSHRSQIKGPRPCQPTNTLAFPGSDKLSTHTQKGLWICETENQKVQPLMASPQDNDSLIRREPGKKPSMTESIQRSRNNRITRGMMAGPIASTPQVAINWIWLNSILTKPTSYYSLLLLMFFLVGVKQKKAESKGRSASAVAQKRRRKQAVTGWTFSDWFTSTKLRKLPNWNERSKPRSSETGVAEHTRESAKWKQLWRSGTRQTDDKKVNSFRLPIVIYLLQCHVLILWKWFCYWFQSFVIHNAIYAVTFF